MAPSQLDLEAADATGADAATPVARLTRVRVLALAATGPLVTGYAAVAALFALVTAIAPLAHFSTTGVLGAALPGWLAAHQVPVSLGAVEFGALPLLPTIILMFLAARAAAGAADRLGLTEPRQAGLVIGSIAGAHGVCGLVVALSYPGRYVDVDPLAAFYYPALLAALAATAGVLRRCGLAAALVTRADGVAVRGLAAGAVAVALLLTAGAAVFTFGLLTSVGTTRDLFATFAPGVGNGLGMLLLSLGYVPNAVIAAAAFVAGPGFELGSVTLSPLEFSGGGVPGLPLLAALPEEQAAWWPMLCLLPLGVGVVLGQRLRYVAEDPVTRMRGVAVAAGVVALAFVVLAGSAGGRLGAGAFDPVSMRAAAVSVALALWVGVPAAAITWFGGPRPIHEPVPGPIPADDPEPEGEAGDAADAAVGEEPDGSDDPGGAAKVGEERDGSDVPGGAVGAANVGEADDAVGAEATGGESGGADVPGGAADGGESGGAGVLGGAMDAKATGEEPGDPDEPDDEPAKATE